MPVWIPGVDIFLRTSFKMLEKGSIQAGIPVQVICSRDVEVFSSKKKKSANLT